MPAIFVILIVLAIYFTFVTCYLPAANLPLSYAFSRRHVVESVAGLMSGIEC